MLHPTAGARRLQSAGFNDVLVSLNSDSYNNVRVDYLTITRIRDIFH